MNRNQFLKTCVAGSCGFGMLGLKSHGGSIDPQQGVDCSLQKNWISEMLHQMTSVEEEKARIIFKNMAQIHYQQLQMDKILEPHIGNLDGFISFLEKEWGWKIFYDKEKNIIIADENKDHCVCPMINRDVENVSLMCYCSEGFAERMFSTVTGENAKAVVISSVLKGNETCKYQINL